VVGAVCVGGLLAASAAVAGQAQTAAWGENAVKYRGKNGKHFTYSCPARTPVPLKVLPVWGDGVYTDTSQVCLAAVHAGQITYAQGGTVTIEIRPGRDSYDGRSSNGIQSRSFGPSPGSFYFVETEDSATAAYRNDAADVCNDIGTQIAALGNPTKATLGNYLIKAYALGLHEPERLRRLDPPAAFRSLHQQVAAIVQREVDLLGQAVTRIQAGADAVAAYNAIAGNFERLAQQENAIWRKLEVTGCLG